MGFRKYLLAPWAAVSFYAISTMVAGAGGLEAYRELLREKERLSENLEDLKTLNQELTGIKEGLYDDPESIRVRARELGFGDPDEHFVRIVGLPGVRYQELSPGMVETARRPAYIPDTSLRMISVLIGLGIFLILFVKDILFSGFSATRPRQSYQDSIP